MTSPRVRSFLMRHDMQQDRLALVCERACAGPCLVWVTHQMATDLVLALVNILSHSVDGARHGRGPVMSLGLAQLQVASAANDNALLIEEPDDINEQHVAVGLEVTTSGPFLSASFRCGEAMVVLRLNSVLSAQWLRLIHAHFSIAQWHYPDWPDWLCLEASRSFLRPDVVLYCDWHAETPGP